MDEVNTADLQLLKASTTRIERDMDRLDRKLDSFLQQHQVKHDAEQSAANAQLLSTSDIMGRGLRHEGELLAMDHRLETLETWRHELLGAMSLMRLTFGASILASVIGVISLVALLGGLVR